MSPERLVLSATDKRQRLLYLSLVLAPLAMSVLNSWGMHFVLWGCPLLEWIGVPCMAWGLTRSFYATAQGNLGQAVDFHLFGPILVGCFAIAALHLGLELLQNRPIRTFYTTWVGCQRFWLLSFCVITGYHMTRLVTLQSSGQIQQWFAQSIVGQWF